MDEKIRTKETEKETERSTDGKMLMGKGKK